MLTGEVVHGLGVADGQDIILDGDEQAGTAGFDFAPRTSFCCRLVFDETESGSAELARLSL